jgi:hypothetical protein
MSRILFSCDQERCSATEPLATLTEKGFGCVPRRARDPGRSLSVNLDRSHLLIDHSEFSRSNGADETKLLQPSTPMMRTAASVHPAARAFRSPMGGNGDCPRPDCQRPCFRRSSLRVSGGSCRPLEPWQMAFTSDVRWARTVTDTPGQGAFPSFPVTR